MPSPNYAAYSPLIVFVDDVGGSGGTSLIAANFNGLRNDLATYVENHINGGANNHSTGDLLDAQFGEVTAYANVAGTQYSQAIRNDMFAVIFKQVLGSTGTLTARIAAFLALTGADLTSTHTTLAAATSVASPGALVKWDATTGSITPPAATISRNIAFEISPYAANPISNTVNYRGGYYTDRTGTNPTARFLANGTTAHATPAAGLARWDVVSLNIGAGTVSVTTGTAATIGTEGFPVPANPNDWVLYYVHTTAAMTGIKDGYDGTNGYILNVSTLNFGGGTGTGGGGGNLTGEPFVTIGNDTLLTNETDIFALGAGTASGTVNGKDLTKFRVTPAILRSEDPATVAHASSLADFLGQAPGQVALHARNYLSAGSSTVYLNPCTLAISGVLKTITTQQSVTIAPSAGVYYVYVDSAGLTDGTFALFVSPTNPTITVTRQLLATMVHTGSYFLGDPYIDFQPLNEVTSTQMRPLKWHFAGYAGQAISGTTQVEVTVATQTIYLPKVMDLVLNGYFSLTGSVAASGQLFAQFDSTVIGIQSIFNEGSSVWTRAIPFGGELDGQVPGAHFLRLYVLLSTGSCTAYSGGYNMIGWCP